MMTMTMMMNDDVYNDDDNDDDVVNDDDANDDDDATHQLLPEWRQAHVSDALPNDLPDRLQESISELRRAGTEWWRWGQWPWFSWLSDYLQGNILELTRQW